MIAHTRTRTNYIPTPLILLYSYSVHDIPHPANKPHSPHELYEVVTSDKDQREDGTATKEAAFLRTVGLCSSGRWFVIGWNNLLPTG